MVVTAEPPGGPLGGPNCVKCVPAESFAVVTVASGCMTGVVEALTRGGTIVALEVDAGWVVGTSLSTTVESIPCCC